MASKRKLVFILLGIAGILVVLFVAVWLFLPRILATEAIRSRVRQAISARIQGPADYRDLSVSYLPRPAVTMTELRLKVPEKAAVTVARMVVVPKILPLLRGKVDLARVSLYQPVVELSVPPGWDPLKALGGDKREKAPRAPLLPFRNVVLEVAGGRLAVERGGALLYDIREMEARVRQAGEEIRSRLSCRSNLWQHLSLRGRFDPVEARGRGTLALKGFTPHELDWLSLPLEGTALVDSLVDLELSVAAEGPRQVAANWEATVAKAVLADAKDRYGFEAPVLNGSLTVRGRQATLSLDRVRFDAPRLAAGGTITFTTPREEGKRPHLALDVTGRGVDVLSTRQALLFLFGEVGAIQQTFEIVRKGTVPRIRFQTAGSGGRELEEHLSITGRMEEGEIFVPQGELYLTEVSGEVTIADAVLTGRELRARLGNTTGKGGELVLGLSDRREVFKLDLRLDADLAQLPPILATYVPDERVLEELDKVQALDGRALGRLTLGDTKEDIQVVVDVEHFSLQGRYARLPHPVSIEEGAFHYGPDEVRAAGIRGRMGASFIRGASVAVIPREPYPARIRIPSAGNPEGEGAAELSLDELVPWLRSFDSLAGVLAPVTRLDGILGIETLTLEGPLLEPAQWEYAATGTAREVLAVLPVLPGPLRVDAAAYRLTPASLSFSRAAAGLLDSRLAGSLTLTGYRQGGERLAGSLEGAVGNDLLAWAWGRMDWPEKYRVKGPIQVLGSELAWERNGALQVDGRFEFQEAVQVGLSLTRSSGELVVDELTVRDDASDADLALQLEEKEIRLVFAGNLSHTTLNRMLANDQLFRGQIQGRFQAGIDLADPGASTASGHLQGRNLSSPFLSRLDAGIEQVRIEAQERLIRIVSSTFSWQERLLEVTGDFRFSPDALVFDLNLNAQSLLWEQIGALAGVMAPDGEGPEGEGEPGPGFPVRGSLNLDVANFIYQDYLWHPLEARVILEPDGLIRIAATNAKLCGISTPGEILVRWPVVDFEMEANADANLLDPTLFCLANQKELATGVFDLNAGFGARAEAVDLLNALGGDIVFRAEEGRIYRFGLLAKIFSLLNVSELFQGDLPDLAEEGFAYSSISIRAAIEGGVLKFQEAIIDGQDMEIACHGEIDLQAMEMDLTVLVAPLKTIDMIIKRIPLIRSIFEGTLVSIPVSVRGPVKDPQVVPLSPSAVGSEILGIMRRTLELPIELVQPLIPEGSEAEESD